MKILTIDPGHDTGYSVWDNNTLIQTGVINTYDNFMKFLKEIKCDFVVLEDFTGSGRITKEKLYTIRLCGAIRYKCYLDDIPLHLQYPTQLPGYLPLAKNLLPLERIPHIIDAVAHGLRYLMKEKKYAITVINSRI